jgi:hypothetical protein
MCGAEEKFGEEAGEALRDKLEKNRDYEVMPQFPEDKALWLYRVYNGIVVSKGIERKKVLGMSIRGRVAQDAETSALVQMVADEMDEVPKLNDVHLTEGDDNPKKGRGRRGAKGKGKGKGNVTDHVASPAPKRVRKVKEPPADDGTPDHVKKACVANNCETHRSKSVNC